MGNLSGTTKTSITVDDIKEALQKLDVITKPYIVVCCIDIEEKLKAAVGDKMTVVGFPYVEKDKVIVIEKDSDFGRQIMNTVEMV